MGGANTIDINPSVQHVLNCGSAGSCYGGSAGSTYQWIHQNGGISIETSNPYLACTGLSHYPNITISDYGSIRGTDAMQKEIFNRGPIACGIAADPLLNYESGIVVNSDRGVDHVVSVVGWGHDDSKGNYWIVRNSWGEFWGEFGYVRVAFGSLGLDNCNWATIGDYTAPEKHNQVHCHEGGENCKASDSVV